MFAIHAGGHVTPPHNSLNRFGIISLLIAGLLAATALGAREMHIARAPFIIGTAISANPFQPAAPANRPAMGVGEAAEITQVIGAIALADAARTALDATLPPSPVAIAAQPSTTAARQYPLELTSHLARDALLGTERRQSAAAVSAPAGGHYIPSARR